MTTWTQFTSAADVDALLASCRGFHDGILRNMRVTTGGQIGPTTVSVMLAELQGPTPAVEIRCERLVELRLRPSKPDCDSIIAAGRITTAGDVLVLALNFIGGPLRGPPGGHIVIPWRDLDDPDIYVSARSMAWRAAENPSSAQNA
ncbi:MAG: hypothetical protein K8T90_21015 [Planctomycetes bacterium]|nr:hypothetical protein [Planctomycetota bacterium]